MLFNALGLIQMRSSALRFFFSFRSFWPSMSWFAHLFAVFTESIGGDILDIVWAWSVYLLVTGILIIIIGNVSDEKKRKEKLMVIGFVIRV